MKRALLLLFIISFSVTLLPNAVVNQSTALEQTPKAYLALKHPFIWATYAERQRIVDNIQQYAWANSLFLQLKNRVDSLVNIHKSDPSATLKAISTIPDYHGERSNHNDVLTSASEAAILYYLTNNKDYAQYAADILNHYNTHLAMMEAKKQISASTGLFFNDWWLESRALFPKIAIIYDFVYNYVKNPDNTVFDLATNSRKTFDNSAAQKTSEILAKVVFKSISAQNCNHSVLAGNGALFNLLMIEDDAKRDLFFDYFYNDPLKFPFDAYTWTLNNFTSQNIWDETLSYSKGSHTLILQSMNIIDRYKPELDIINKNKRILNGYPFYENFFYPSGEAVRFGDAGSADLLDGYELILQIATRKNYSDIIAKTKRTLQYQYNKRGGRHPKIETARLEWINPLVLLWAENVEDTVVAKPPVLATNTAIEHAGIIVQRNYYTPDIKTNGMMLYNGGASYVHTHSTGIDMVLYGKGLVMGAESGSGTYLTDEHVNYRVKLAAHNTVIVNGSGISGGGWDTRMSKVNLVSCEPKVNDAPVSTNFSFTTQFIDDTYNNCLQQRTNSIIRTSPTTAYYFDSFRSKSKTEDKFHDYIYHNIGDTLTLKYSESVDVPLIASTKYSTDINGSVTGWKFFNYVESSAATLQAVKATFKLNKIGKYMNVFIPSGTKREYATAKALYTKGATNGYSDKKTPVLTIRQFGEAWNKPFIAVFEPTIGENASVQSIKQLTNRDKTVGAIVVSKVGDSIITDYIISQDNADDTYSNEKLKLQFTGRFGIVRTEKCNVKTKVSLYIGDGKKLVYKGIKLEVDKQNSAYKIIK